MKKTVSAGIIIFRKTPDGIKYLLLYAGKNYWNFPKGKIEKSERSWETALREINEETGLKPQELKIKENFKEFEKFIFKHEKEKILRVIILYLAETTQARVTIRPEEHEGFGWFTFSEAQKVLTKHKDTATILRRAHRFIVGGGPALQHGVGRGSAQRAPIGHLQQALPQQQPLNPAGIAIPRPLERGGIQRRESFGQRRRGYYPHRRNYPQQQRGAPPIVPGAPSGGMPSAS